MKIIKIISCQNCPFLLKYFIKKNGGCCQLHPNWPEIDDTKIIPNWCPLDDSNAPTALVGTY